MKKSLYKKIKSSNMKKKLFCKMIKSSNKKKKIYSKLNKFPNKKKNSFNRKKDFKIWNSLFIILLKKMIDNIYQIYIFENI